ncbi:two-component system, response regulator, stage 0 sporulation protein F [Amphibacillus marinus]|uniref:Two-component system, response regulator, stage 0 sporulation protein F n=1 Tax=Amphibacillus marinus TaxID=872970 RepID=A0A1H8MZM6_9BACI|nr:response regulator [Amphibacillus marinus]SEO22855.1 two-component system, response regulator, stage 0 sporulation protein F [Amphibacillus marinus]
MDKNILIVDDQRGIRFLLEEIVKSEGYQVKSCENGIIAIKEIETKPPDLLIIDYRLPLMNGAKVIALLEEKGYYIPTIVMSGLVEEIKPTTDQYSSVKNYFSKPFNILEAKETINYILRE